MGLRATRGVIKRKTTSMNCQMFGRNAGVERRCFDRALDSGKVSTDTGAYETVKCLIHVDPNGGRSLTVEVLVDTDVNRLEGSAYVCMISNVFSEYITQDFILLLRIKCL